MSDNYDSILKEKKVYEEYTPKNTAFKKFMRFGFLLVIIVIIISYIVYYNTFLNGETILLNDFLKLVDNYSIVMDGVKSKYDFTSNYMLTGEIVSDSNKYNYSFIRDKDKMKRTFFNGDNSISFYNDDKSSYMKLSNFDNYISVDNEYLSFDDYRDDYAFLNSSIFDYFNNILFDESIMSIYNRFYTIDNYDTVVSDVRNNFLDFISDKNYSRKFYFYNGRPVIKIDLSLDSKDLNKILSNGDNNLIVKDDYKVIITTRNDAIMNDIKNIKIIVNNKTKNTRNVFLYDGEYLYFTNVDGIEYKFEISNTADRFDLKIYKRDSLYSALEGSKVDDKYVYNYQLIDKYERYTLEVGFNDNKYNYTFISIVNGDSKSISVTGEYSDDGAINEGAFNTSMYRDIDDWYRNIINNKLVEYLK